MSETARERGQAFPALTGYEPLSLGRRVMIYGIDILLAGVVAAVAVAAAASLAPGSVQARYVALGVAGLVEVLCWVLFSARLAGLLFGARYVSVGTGRPAHLRLLAHKLLEGVLAAVTVFVAPLVLVFATVRRPLLRNWFDRVCGVALVDTSIGRRLGDAPPPLTPTEPVSVPGRADYNPYRDPELAPAAGASAADRRRAAAERAAASRLEAAARSAAAAPAPVVVTGPRAVLDDGRVLVLDPPSILGRSPRGDADPSAMLVAVDDPAASKTHLMIGRDEHGVWVQDLDSRNGVGVRGPSGARQRLAPGIAVHVAEGSQITFARRTITIEA